MKFAYQNSINHKLKLSYLFVCFAIFGSISLRAETYFNPHFLSDDPTKVADLSGFETGLEAPPGTYRVDVYMNGGFVITRDVSFKLSKSGKALVPCLTSGQLSSLGVNTLAIPGMSRLAAKECVPFTEMIKDASSEFDAGRQRLSIHIPQASMSNSARGYIPPEQWDNGINAGILNYSITGNNVNNQTGGTSNYAYANLQSGINLGAWRLRDNSAWNYSSGGSNTVSENKWQHINTFLERDISALRSRLTMGDGYTSGDIFDSVNFRGMQLASDDNMLPDSLRGFSPVIHGIARGTAKVTVKQNGYEVYQTTVSPGPFTINDIYASGNSGNLQVTVQEVDGTSQVFTVPYASVPDLQREGFAKYTVIAGEFRSGNTQQDMPDFIQSTLMRGLPKGWTATGGTQLTNNYRAINVGMAKDLGDYGAVSFDITQADSTLADESKHQGQSLRILYNKSLNDWGTNIQVLGYRYSTQGYYTLADTTWKKMNGYTVVTDDGLAEITPQYTDFYNLNYNRRGSMQVTLTQQTGNNSNLYLTGSQQSYWRTESVDEQLQAGYSSSINDITYTMSYSLTKSAWQPGQDKMLAFNINIPFSHWLRSDSQSEFRHSNATYSMSDDFKGGSTNLAGVNGTLLKDNNLTYSVQTGYNSTNSNSSQNTQNAALSYRGTYGNSNIGYSRSNGYSQTYYGLSGGVIAHQNGITFSQPLNDTIVLVKAPGANDVAVENQTGVRTDWRGYAVLPYATDYRENRVALDANSLSNNVDLDDAVVTVIPTHGAVVRADFKTHVGLKILMTLKNKGKPLPFGSIVSFNNGDSEGIIADNGLVYMTGLPPAGQVKAHWGDNADQGCTADYRIMSENQKQTLYSVTSNCK